MSYSAAPSLSVNQEGQIKTWQVFLLVLCANSLAGWMFNDLILTREVYHRLLAEQMEANRIDEYFDFVRELSAWGYFFQPALLWVQITFFVLLLQMPLVLASVDTPFRQLFRTVTYAAIPMTVATFARVLRFLFMEPSDVALESLNVVPLSIASFLDPAQYPAAAFAVLNKFNPFEAAWCVVIYRGLVSTGQLKKEIAALLIFCIWVMLLLLQWGLIAYLDGVNR